MLHTPSLAALLTMTRRVPHCLMAVFTGRFTSALTHQEKCNTNETGSEDLRNGKTGSTNRRVLHLILVHASNHPQSLYVQLELNRRIGIVVGDCFVLVPHLKSGE